MSFGRAPQPGSEAELLAYLDDRLTPERRASFETTLARDESLADRVRSHRRIDEALRRRLAPPPAEAVVSALRVHLDELERPAADESGGPRFRRGPWVLAASLLLALAGGWLTVRALLPAGGSNPYGPHRPMIAVYEADVAGGFEPEWVCETPAIFAETFREHYGQALEQPEPSEGFTLIGLGYSSTISERTTRILARVEGAPVLVFVDRREVDRGPRRLPEGVPLHLFRRDVGRLVLYELTPLDAPRVLPSLSFPGPADRPN